MRTIAGNGLGIFGKVSTPYIWFAPLEKVTDSSVHELALVEVGVPVLHPESIKNNNEINRKRCMNAI
jgi:hypothetical protein